MLDVHPPHHSVNTWRDFFTHILTITVGLLIALGLEAAVEAMHHRRVVREARENIRTEIEQNQALLAADARALAQDRDSLRANILLLTRYKDRSRQGAVPELKFPWHWNSPLSAAWDTARNTGAVALMPYDDAHAFSLVYTQQSYVNDQATLYINHHYAAMVPLHTGGDLATMPPTQVDELIHGCAVTLADIEYLETLMHGLDGNYTALQQQR